MSSRTIRSTQSKLEMVRKSKLRTSGRSTMVRDTDHYIYMYTFDGQCFDSLDWRREMHNCFDDDPDGALRALSNGIKLILNSLADAEM
jgi:hypothetical protein